MRPIWGLVVVAAALTLAQAARADVPVGFISRPALAQRVATVATKTVSVYCAQTDADWSVATAARSARAGSDVLAYVDAVAGSTIFLSPTVCVPLLAKINGRRVTMFDFGATLQVFAHEAEHIAGHADEGEAECAALAVLPALARQSFGIKKAITLRAVMRGAWDNHKAAVQYSEAYRGSCG